MELPNLTGSAACSLFAFKKMYVWSEGFRLKIRMRATKKSCRSKRRADFFSQLKEGKRGKKENERQRWVWRTEIAMLSCNRGLIWPDLERTNVHGRAHTSRVTGHKEPLCQVTEHREKDKGLEGCDMTNMRGFAGLWGNWHYSRGWLTLLICITHQSRSQHRRADKPHAWSPDTWVKTQLPQNVPKRGSLCNVASGLPTPTQRKTFDSCTGILAGRGPKHVISRMEMHIYGVRCP